MADETELVEQVARIAERYAGAVNAHMLADDILEIPAIALALQGKGPRRCSCCHKAADYLECGECVRLWLTDD